MPRPGPRPYECVRRAWHSDRHRPLRGSIIRQIFSVVNEAHSPVTKKNREWQEKLPIVVFKAEEIMYSKANSEAEYLSPDTLWDRVNDAINTIIRRDESTETGELLPPCVEAALNLGCVPVRASRSQRHSHPRTYLGQRAPEPASTPPRVFESTNDERCPQTLPLQSSNQYNFPRPVTTMNSTRPVTESSNVIGNTNIVAPCNYPFIYDKPPQAPPVIDQLMTVDTNTPLNSGSVYPLYYATQNRTEESHVVPTIPENAEPNTIFFGTPICTSVLEPTEMGIRKVLSRTGADSATSRTVQADNWDTCEILPGMECDLSLRLGLFSDSYSGVEKSLARETERVSRTSQEGGEISDLSQQRNKEFCFFPRKLSEGSFQSRSSRLFPQDEGLRLEASVGKHKSPFSNNLDDEEFCWHPELPSNHFMSRVKGPGLVGSGLLE